MGPLREFGKEPCLAQRVGDVERDEVLVQLCKGYYYKLRESCDRCHEVP